MPKRLLIPALLLVLAALAGADRSLSAPPVPPHLVYPTIKAQLPKDAAASTPSRTLSTPVGEGFRVTVPAALAADPLAKMGYVSVTHPLFGADPTGATDSTLAIRKAVAFARDHQMVCYFPLGDYLISDTIECVQNFYMRTTGHLDGARLFPCVLLGEKSVVGLRPVIRLAPGSIGFELASVPKYVLHFWARSLPHTKRTHEDPQPNIHMNQMLIGIDVEIGPNNPGAVGVRMRGAQGCSVQDCFINATHGRTGLEGGAGSGGGFHNVHILGGDVGLDMVETQPAPTISGITLERQRTHAIVYKGRQTLSAVGLRILTEDPVVAIAGPPKPMRAHQGQICLVDSEIIFAGRPGVLLDTASAAYLENVYVHNAEALVRSKGNVLVSGEADRWLRIGEYAFGTPPREYAGYSFQSNIYVDGQVRAVLEPALTRDVLPPTDLFDRHRWPGDFPAFSDPDAANAADYGARGDDNGDDTAALQRALNENTTVFLPKGYYLISKPLELRPGARLIGAARHLSVILPDFSAPAFADPKNPSPLVRTADAPDADTILAFLHLYTPRAAVGAYALHWRSGGRSVVRDLEFENAPLHGYRYSPDTRRDAPLVRITGNGGGNWYDAHQEGWRVHGKPYRHFLVDGVTGPLRFYHLNAEHSRGEANVEIKNSTDVSIFGLKGEGNDPVLLVSGSKHVRVYGYGGNAAAHPAKSLFIFRESRDFLVALAVDSPRVKGGKVNSQPGLGVPPDKWYMIHDRPLGQGVFRTPPADRPTLYKRGTPTPPTPEPAPAPATQPAGGGHSVRNPATL